MFQGDRPAASGKKRKQRDYKERAERSEAGQVGESRMEGEVPRHDMRECSRIQTAGSHRSVGDGKVLPPVHSSLDSASHRTHSQLSARVRNSQYAVAGGNATRLAVGEGKYATHSQLLARVRSTKSSQSSANPSSCKSTYLRSLTAGLQLADTAVAARRSSPNAVATSAFIPSRLLLLSSPLPRQRQTQGPPTPPRPLRRNTRSPSRPSVGRGRRRAVPEGGRASQARKQLPG